MILKQDKDSLNTVVTKLSPQGDIIWSKAYGLAEGNPTLGVFFDNIILDRPNGGMAIFSNIQDSITTATRPYIALIDSLGEIEKAMLINIDGFKSINTAQKTPDGGFIVSGFLPQGMGTNSFLIKLDSSATIEWSKSYNFGLTFINRGVEPTDSNTYIISGSTTTSLTTLPRAYIAQVDSIGDLIWMKYAGSNAPIANTTIFRKLVRLKDGNFQAAGTLSDDSWVVKFDANGDILWQKQYQEASSPEDVHATGDGGSIISYTTELMDNPGTSVLHLIKLNTDGESSCETNVDSIFIDPSFNPNLVDSLEWDSIFTDLVLDRSPQDSIYNGFNPPTLTLTPPPPFCEGDPIMVEFDATTEGATSYTWGGEAEGQTTAIITATTAGMYTVDVRIDSLVCYNLCDTVIISEIGPPMAEIAQVGNVCVDGSSFLVANIDGFATDFLWSTGDDTPTTAITELGTYSVTVSNQCGANEAVTTLTDELSVSIAQLGDLCANGIDTLAAVVNGAATNFTWNTGEGEETINITAEGDYAVVVSNLCSEASAEINVDCVFQVDACIGVPNAFTPDNDSDNDTFNVIIAPECQAGITVRKIEIWNRWGELVYESANGQAWDGTQNGEDAASDVYLYLIEVEIIDEEDAIFKGDLTLIR